jgi:hypothetical protein
MDVGTAESLKGYHYTNPHNYRSMQGKGIRGYTSTGYEDFSGLIPRRRFVSLYHCNLPDEAHEGVIEGLLEPEPKSWIANPEFPCLWGYLMHDICRENEVMLLSFELKPEDLAYVAERAHIERDLYKESKGLGVSTRISRNEAYIKYWESRVPAMEYDGSYSVPQLAIWSGIPFERLNVEWIKPTDEVWKRVLKNNW